jgi:hypothetical protein
MKWSVLIMITYGLAFGGYQLMLRLWSPPAETIVLRYKHALSIGAAVTPQDLNVSRARISEPLDGLVTTQEKKMIEAVPLIREVGSGDLVRKVDFLLSADETGRLGSGYRSLWIQHLDHPHPFVDGSHVDLFDSSGKRVYTDAIIIRNEKDGYMVAVRRERVDDIIRAMKNNNSVVPVLRHVGASAEEGVGGRALSRIHSGVSWINEGVLSSP